MVIANLWINRYNIDIIRSEVYFCNEPEESSAKQGSLLRVSGALDLEMMYVL